MEKKISRFNATDWSKIHEIPHLADCPWPPADSHCSPCTIHDDNEVGFFVWGEYDGNPNRKSFHAQTFCVEEWPYGKIKRFVFKIARTRSTAVPEYDGMFIGIVDTDTLNDPDKLYDPSQWEWAGYLATLPGGAPIEQYYLCADIDQTIDPTKWWYLLMVTNGSYEICGWQMGGFGREGYPEGVQPLWRYFFNEPGQPDGWQVVDNWFRGCVIPYCEGGGALVEGDCEIINPNFPGTAQWNVPWSFGFTANQKTAFPCGCPETVCYNIEDRDTGDIILSDSFNLDCGYTGVNFSGSITFQNGGPYTFHGRLNLGHVEGSDCIIDDQHDFDVQIGGLSCEEYTDPSDCENAGCYWYNNGCHSSPPSSCEILNNQSDCMAYGCYWYDGSCHTNPQGICNGDIDTSSIFHTGPFDPGTHQLLAHLGMGNVGTQNGCLIQAKFVEFPGTPDEAQLGGIWNRIIDAGEVTFIDFYWDTPIGGATSWPLGVKVWAPEFESEPSWGSMGAKIFKIRRIR